MDGGGERLLPRGEVNGRWRFKNRSIMWVVLYSYSPSIRNGTQNSRHPFSFPYSCAAVLCELTRCDSDTFLYQLAHSLAQGVLVAYVFARGGIY